MSHSASTRGRQSTFASYRFGDEELGSSIVREPPSPTGKMGRGRWGRARRWGGALGRARRAVGRERFGWLVMIGLVLVWRRTFSGSGGSGRRGEAVVMRRSSAERLRMAPISGEEASELVVVPGHAVYTGSDFTAAKDTGNWALEPYQLLEGEAKSFMDHMELGVKELSRNPKAVLMFSGGKTRREAGPLSEASSYWQVARAFDWFGADVGVESRVFTEEHARDSFENLLFSMCRFYELTGAFPKKITVVGFQSKRARFEDLHLSALGYPSANFTYIGTPALNEKEMASGEVKVRESFTRDPYGCRGELAQKRVERDPFNEGAPYFESLKILRGLWLHINTCSQRMYKGVLPWSPGVTVK